MGHLPQAGKNGVQIWKIPDVCVSSWPDSIQKPLSVPAYNRVIGHFDLNDMIRLTRLFVELATPFGRIIQPFGEPFPLK